MLFRSWFPEMLEYTFPDLLMTVRNPAPVTSRNMSNFTLVSHLKNEIECRYLADVRYLKENRIPEIEDYSNVTTKPDLALVRSQDPVAMRNYQKKLADFQDSHKALLKTGRFMDVHHRIWADGRELRGGRCAGDHFCLCRLCRGSDIRRVRFRGAVWNRH